MPRNSLPGAPPPSGSGPPSAQPTSSIRQRSGGAGFIPISRACVASRSGGSEGTPAPDRDLGVRRARRCGAGRRPREPALRPERLPRLIDDRWPARRMGLRVGSSQGNPPFPTEERTRIAPIQATRNECCGVDFAALGVVAPAEAAVDYFLEVNGVRGVEDAKQAKSIDVESFSWGARPRRQEGRRTCTTQRHEEGTWQVRRSSSGWCRARPSRALS